MGGAWPCWGATGGFPGAPPPDLTRLLQDRGSLESELATAAVSAGLATISGLHSGVLDLGITNYVISSSIACNASVQIPI